MRGLGVEGGRHEETGAMFLKRDELGVEGNVTAKLMETKHSAAARRR